MVSNMIIEKQIDDFLQVAEKFLVCFTLRMCAGESRYVAYEQASVGIALDNDGESRFHARSVSDWRPRAVGAEA